MLAPLFKFVCRSSVVFVIGEGSVTWGFVVTKLVFVGARHDSLLVFRASGGVVGIFFSLVSVARGVRYMV